MVLKESTPSLAEEMVNRFIYGVAEKPREGQKVDVRVIAEVFNDWGIQLVVRPRQTETGDFTFDCIVEPISEKVKQLTHSQRLIVAASREGKLAYEGCWFLYEVLQRYGRTHDTSDWAQQLTPPDNLLQYPEFLSWHTAANEGAPDVDVDIASLAELGGTLWHLTPSGMRTELESRGIGGPEGFQVRV